MPELLAIVLRAAGRRDEALAAVAAAIERYEAKGNIAVVKRTRELFADLLG